ncbi:MAG: beta-N-acetylhexosaminidase [Bacteroidota bacterium]
MKKYIFVLGWLAIWVLGACAPKSPTYKPVANIVPMPQQMDTSGIPFLLTSNATIYYTTDTLRSSADFLQRYISQMSGISIVTKKGVATEKGIVLQLSEKEDLPDEGYHLRVTPKRVVITSASPAGVFRGIQSVIQLLPDTTREEIWLAGVDITDWPEYSWRGMHLDVCRHFYDTAFVKKYIDLLALHKMNRFHWHLTEDQGWRIEIKQYPKLTEIGACRDETMVGKNWDEFDGEPHGGFYTQQEIREIVAYAQDRFITIVPEIEMPGHSSAALAAYPQLGCTGGPYEVQKVWGVFDEVYCAGKEETFTFLQNVLDEVMALFPSEYIHIGGDECPKIRWEECPECQRRIKDEALGNEQELQSWFIKRMEKYLNAHGRKLIGWDEILEGGLAPEASVMSWRGTEGGIKAARMGHDVVMSPNSHCYFDHYQGNPDKEPLAIGGHTTLKEVYQYRPTPEELDATEALHILGAQGNVWTEYIATPEHLEYMVLPRMCALAEVVWTAPQEPDFSAFYNRLETWLPKLKQVGYSYRPLDSEEK